MVEVEIRAMWYMWYLIEYGTEGTSYNVECGTSVTPCNMAQVVPHREADMLPHRCAIRAIFVVQRSGSAKLTY